MTRNEAEQAYRRALAARPHDATIAYRLKGALRLAGRSTELAELAPRLDAIIKFPDLARDFFDRLNDLPDLGLESHPELFRELASALRAVGRNDEAAAWSELAIGPKRGLP